MLKTSSIFTALPVSVSNGGTGQTSLPVGYVLLGNGLSPIASVAPGTAGNILTSNGSSWISTSASNVSVSTATNLADGAAGSVPYQSAANTTTFLSVGSANTVMTSTGTAPQWGTSLTGVSLNNGVVGGTTPAAGTFTTLIGGGGSANYGQLTGGATTKVVEFKALGSDTNVGYVIRSQGTGAIDLAPGSSGVNVSNGGTVTALTGTNTGTNYTSAPTVAISAPTTAGGVTATASWPIMVSTVVVANGGTGYTVGDLLTVQGGTFTQSAVFTVSTVSSGVITAITVSGTARGTYTVAPANPASVTGGTGSGATFTLTFSLVNHTAPTITNAGSGYVEQPTVSFSGGGGSGATAYATVGSGTTVRSLGSSMSFYTPGGEQVRVTEPSGTAANYVGLTGAVVSGSPLVSSAGSDTNINLVYVTKGTGEHRFATNSSGSNIQLRVTHTASAVNYVQVTGSATSPSASTIPTIQTTGSDSVTYLGIGVKGAGYIAFFGSGSTTSQAFRISTTNSNATGNLIAVQGAAAGSAPSIQAISGTSGTDTDIDLALTPKGAGYVKFGTHTATADTAISGYITVKTADGVTRKLAVIT